MVTRLASGKSKVLRNFGDLIADDGAGRCCGRGRGLESASGEAMIEDAFTAFTSAGDG
jgi:hypothetical protein